MAKKDAKQEPEIAEHRTVLGPTKAARTVVIGRKGEPEVMQERAERIASGEEKAPKIELRESVPTRSAGTVAGDVIDPKALEAQGDKNGGKE